MEEGGTSAEVEQETVRAVVEAYAAGQLFQTLEAFVKGGRPLKGGVGLPGAITRLQEPVDGQDAENGSARPRACRRTQRRPHQRRSVPTRLAADPMAGRQGSIAARIKFEET